MTEKELKDRGFKIIYWFVWQKSVLLEDTEGHGYSAKYTNDTPPKFFDLQSHREPDKVIVLT